MTVACADVCLSSGGFGPSALHRGLDGLLTPLRPSSGSHRPGASGGAASPLPRLRARAPGPQLGRADRTRQGWADACLLVRWARGLAWAPLSRPRAPRGQDRAAPRGQPGRASSQAPGKRLGCRPGPAPSWFLSLGRRWVEAGPSPGEQCGSDYSESRCLSNSQRDTRAGPFEAWSTAP